MDDLPILSSSTDDPEESLASYSSEYSYSEQEEHIAAARRFYNSAVKDLNNAVEIFPSSLVAMLLNIKQAPFFEANEQERQRIDASQYFS